MNHRLLRTDIAHKSMGIEIDTTKMKLMVIVKELEIKTLQIVMLVR
jgi:hypothetical protein